jgi:hypothetical protein
MKRRISSFFRKHPALNFAGIIALFILIEGLYSFCSKGSKIDCPAFDDVSFDNWFPYQPNQILNFSSSLNNNDVVTIERVQKSGEYTGYGSCETSAQVVSKEQWNGALKLYINFMDLGSEDALTLSFYNFNTSGTLLENNYVPQSSGQESDFLANTVINGRSFSNVFQVQVDTNVIKQEGVYKIWLSKQAGLIGYERYPSLEQFVKQ